ncbi:MAG TPA: hypothetical protein VIL30_25820, partial [Ramlibacter sp.]
KTIFLAMDLCAQVRKHSCEVIGPAPTLGLGRALLIRCPCSDGCIFDIRLENQFVYPLAELALEMGIPFIFASGESPDCVPEIFKGIAFFSKPLEMKHACSALFPSSSRPGSGT